MMMIDLEYKGKDPDLYKENASDNHRVYDLSPNF